MYVRTYTGHWLSSALRPCPELNHWRQFFSIRWRNLHTRPLVHAEDLGLNTACFWTSTADSTGQKTGRGFLVKKGLKLLRFLLQLQLRLGLLLLHRVVVRGHVVTRRSPTAWTRSGWGVRAAAAAANAGAVGSATAPPLRPSPPPWPPWPMAASYLSY
jgi:hypothetical protein